VRTGSVWGDYVQWCSLVGTDVVCDEGCLREGAEWTTAEAPGVNRDLFCAIRDVIQSVRNERVHHGYGDSGPWSDWGRGFAAGLCSVRNAWHAAQVARSEGIFDEADPAARQLALAAEDTAWAAVHAAAGNVALALHSLARARRLVGSPLGVGMGQAAVSTLVDRPVRDRPAESC
jgi:hypothetical protein